MADPTFHSTRRPLRWRLLAVLVAFGLALAACGADNDTASAVEDAAFDAVDAGADAMEAPADQAMGESEASGDFDDAALADSDSNAIGSGGGTPPPLNTAQLGREIIFTATINVGVDDVAAAGTQATDIINDIGGFVFGQNTQGGAEPQSTITFKVRPEDFSEALDRLGGIGELRNQTVSTDDVTERVVDLTSRIEVADLGVQRLREAMENTTTLTDFAELEQLLLIRESDLEVMRGQLRTIRDRIDLATITLTLEQDRVTNSVELFFTVYEGHDDGAACPGQQPNQVTFEPGDDVTLCFETLNNGDQALSDITVTETVLEIDGTDELITVFGETDDLQPGQSVVQAYELTADRQRALRVSVTATPTDGVSTEPAGPAVRAQGTPVLRVDEDAVDPGFGDGFDAATELLKNLWTVVKVLAGFVIPLLVLVPFLWIAWALLSRLRAARAERAEERHQRMLAEHAANTPPPPSPERMPEQAEAVSVFDDEDDDAHRDIGRESDSDAEE